MREMETPPLPQAAHPLPPRDPDEENLRILSICHWVGAGLAGLGLLFLALHFLMMRTFFMNPEMWNKKPAAEQPPEQIFLFMKLFYQLGALLIVAFLVANVMSARFLAMRKNRTFSFIVAGLNCIQIPLGTALGIFTFIVLSRPSVERLYAEAAQGDRL